MQEHFQVSLKTGSVNHKKNGKNVAQVHVHKEMSLHQKSEGRYFLLALIYAQYRTNTALFWRFPL